MFRTTTSQEPAGVNVEGVGHLYNQHGRRRSTASAGDERGHRSAGLSDVGFDVWERDLARSAKHVDSLSYGLPERDCYLGRGVPVWVAGLVEHNCNGGHVTATPLAERVIRGGTRQLSRELPNLLKEI